MSRDDTFAAHLRSLEADPPPISVDRDRVLAIGRRRRAARGAGIGAASVALVAGLMSAAISAAPSPHDAALPATTSTPSAPPATAPPSPARAQIDPVTGAITTPFTTFHVTSRELDIMGSAWDLARSQCMADLGYASDFVFAPTRTPPRDTSLDYGIWNRDDLRRSGYDTAVDDRFEGSSIKTSSPQAETAMQTCMDQVRPMGFIFEPTSFDAVAPAKGVTAATYTSQGQAVVDEWTACLDAAGVAGPDEAGSLLPAGVLRMSSQEQLRIGMVDIDCKESTGLRQRLADIDAVNQQEYLDSAPAYVAAYRATVERAVAASRSYLAQSGIEIP
ncbi:hypothetical protein [Cellulomonas timonensis]|uniref:hypothetical protein n=1 Tax=Cellulomonas timonensis TaxID=1689271 RepID=UPI000833659D|nr:hypothetical protein [Cellulomonas timonensis]